MYHQLCLEIKNIMIAVEVFTTLHHSRGVARNLFWGNKGFWGWIKLLKSRSDVILPHKKCTWADFGGV